VDAETGGRERPADTENLTMCRPAPIIRGSTESSEFWKGAFMESSVDLEKRAYDLMGSGLN
jgi:hypothetical protein